MSIPEDLSARLPTPRPDEPAALRQDIADELADHLLSAARREQQTNTSGAPLSDQAAIAAAVARFGEPAAIARRLWWDAMKERIMAQRVLTLMAMTVAAAAIFACFLLWQSMRLSRAEMAEMMQTQRESLAALTAKLETSQQSGGIQWQPLKVRLVDPTGKPVRGAVRCETKGQSSLSDGINTGADGIADFLLPPGPYAVTIECNSYQTWISSLLLPPKPTERTIVCPMPIAEVAPVSFKIDLTYKSGLAAAPKPIYFVAKLHLNHLQIGDLAWGRQAPRGIDEGRVYWLINSDGRVLGQLPEPPPALDKFGNPMARGERAYFPASLGPNPVLQPVKGLSSGNYSLSVVAYVPTVANDDPSKKVPDSAVAVSKDEIPALSRYAPKSGRPTNSMSVSIDVAQADGRVFHVTDEAFLKDPNSLPDDLFTPDETAGVDHAP